MPPIVLMVAEKPSLASSIAGHLSNGRVSSQDLDIDIQSGCTSMSSQISKQQWPQLLQCGTSKATP